MTIRGREIIGRADLVIFADSLVDPAVCAMAPPHAEIVGSSTLTLEEISERMIEAVAAGQTVARLQSGDPAIYGALHEQLLRLDRAGVPYTIVPGISSVFAAAAALGVELTVPRVAQTVILSRISGRASPVPEHEALRELAAHGTTLVLFLSIGHLRRVVEELIAGGYPPETPAAVVYRVSWPDEGTARGTLATIREIVRGRKWTTQALIFVGPALAEESNESLRSRLYAADYTHRFRNARPSATVASVDTEEHTVVGRLPGSEREGGRSQGHAITPTLSQR
jgi:precorrin-4 C11-methyltransferase